MKSYDSQNSSSYLHRHRPFFNNESSTPFFQTKLTIGQAGDKYEQEADAMADHVVNRSSMPSIQQKCASCEQEDKSVLPKLQKMGEEEEEEMQMKSNGNSASTASQELSSQLESSRGSGNVLPDHTRAEMESNFGVDFSNVRVHTGQQAVQMNQSLNAQAFTHGNNVYFNQGKYQPDTTEGRKLIAHELTHTIQQGAVE